MAAHSVDPCTAAAAHLVDIDELELLGVDVAQLLREGEEASGTDKATSSSTVLLGGPCGSTSYFRADDDDDDQGAGGEQSDEDEDLRNQIEDRLRRELENKVKSNPGLRLSIKDQNDATATIPVTIALIDYLTELQWNLEQNPQEFYCSLDLPGTQPVEETPTTTLSDDIPSKRTRSQVKKKL